MVISSNSRSNPVSTVSHEQRELDKDCNEKKKKYNQTAVVQVVRAAQGLLKGEIILDYMSVEQALRIE